MKKIKVLVMDDSALFRRFIVEGLSNYDFIDVVGYATDPIDAQEKIPTLDPDVITSDVEMPHMDGITFVKKMMKESPRRIIIVSAINISVFDAISAGAVDFVRKPVSTDNDVSKQFITDLADKILIASQAKLRMVPNVAEKKDAQLSAVKPAAQASQSQTTRPSAQAPQNPAREVSASQSQGQTHRPAAAPAQSPDAARRPAAQPQSPASRPGQRPSMVNGKVTAAAQAAIANAEKVLSGGLPKEVGDSKISLIALGASTGGTEALLEVVKDMPADTPGIVIVQHMPPGFTKMYADRLNKICNMRVREAQNGDKVERGLILIAPGDLQMSVVKSMGEYSVRCVPGNKVSGHRPSVDVLFSSVAKVAAPDAVGAILTGMGADGAKGLLEMRQNGCYTIGQDEATCVVYGMPMMAYNMGAVVKQAPLDRIAGLILSHVSK
jgi:two-component system, chemotaxis family, protein-glutamate methylesterase/glutaminase